MSFIFVFYNYFVKRFLLLMLYAFLLSLVGNFLSDFFFRNK